MVAVLWTAFIISALVRSPSEIPRFQWLTFPGVDKIIHVILFLIEALLISWSAMRSSSVIIVVGVVTFCLFLGGGLELVQHLFVEGRSGDILDFIADAFGATLGVYIFIKMSKK